MKLATYRAASEERIGVVNTDTGQILDLAAAASAAGRSSAAFTSMLDLIEAGPAALNQARELNERYGGMKDFRVSLSQVTLLAPVPVPPQMRDFLAYPLHVRQAPRGMQRILARRRGDEAAAQAAKADPEVPAAHRDRPIFYITNRFSVVGPDATVTWPRYSQIMDFELEFGIFLSKGGTNIPKAKAHEHIFGYTIFNDFSARDRQIDEMAGRLGPTKGKSFNGGNAMGPWIVTPDEIGDPYSLTSSARVNGETWTTSSTAGALHTFEDMIAYVSEDETLHAGEFFGSGTMNNGCGLELDRFLSDGDVVELEIEKIGVLRNKVVRQAPSS
jgi:2-keto-4-pentenoate hydratase/2-oxohepta-3-ene-1,7-dioic acid hydratase in catechol pathway